MRVRAGKSSARGSGSQADADERPDCVLRRAGAVASGCVRCADAGACGLRADAGGADAGACPIRLSRTRRMAGRASGCASCGARPARRMPARAGACPGALFPWASVSRETLAHGKRAPGQAPARAGIRRAGRAPQDAQPLARPAMRLVRDKRMGHAPASAPPASARNPHAPASAHRTQPEATAPARRSTQSGRSSASACEPEPLADDLPARTRICPRSYREPRHRLPSARPA